MPVSLEQWRASVGGINASSSRVLARCVAKPGRGLGRDILDLLLFLLVAFFFVGLWLVVKWSVSCRTLLRRKHTYRQLILFVAGGFNNVLSTVVNHGKCIQY